MPHHVIRSYLIRKYVPINNQRFTSMQLLLQHDASMMMHASYISINGNFVSLVYLLMQYQKLNV